MLTSAFLLGTSPWMSKVSRSGARSFGYSSASVNRTCKRSADLKSLLPPVGTFRIHGGIKLEGSSCMSSKLIATTDRSSPHLASI